MLGSILVGKPRTFIASGPHGSGVDCAHGMALLRLLIEMWGPCAELLARGLRAFKEREWPQALMAYLHAAALGSAVGMANAAHLLLSEDNEAADSLSAALPRPEGRRVLARSLLRLAHELGDTDASLALADMIYDEAAANAAAAAVARGGGSAAAAAAATAPTENAISAEGRSSYVESLSLYEHVVATVRDPEALYATGHMHQHGLGTQRDLDRAATIFAALSEMGGEEVLPGILAQVGVHLQRVGTWLADIIGARWW